MLKDVLKDALRPLRNAMVGLRVAFYDLRRFLHGYSPNVRGASKEQLSSHLIIHSHAIEKALSRETFEPGRGKFVLIKLRRALDEYKKHNHNEEDFAFQLAQSAVASLAERYRQYGHDESFLRKHLGGWADVKKPRKLTAGSLEFSNKDKIHNDRKNFAEIMKGRYSVRDFAKKSVDVDLLKQAVALAQKSPSVCNRQAAHVYIITNDSVIRHVLSIQTGFRGYDMPPALLLVTAKNNRFLEGKEFGQGYIDGGLFAMSLLLALEYHGLAACPLNAIFDIAPEKKIRNIIGVDQGEFLIMFVAVGHFKSKNRVAMSSRYPVDDAVTVVGNE